MEFAQLTNLLLARARRLGLRNADNGMVDAADCELALYGQLLELVGRYDLPAYTRLNDAMFTTSTGVVTYPVPDDFGRLLSPEDRDRSGLWLDDGSAPQPFGLQYRDPVTFRRLQSDTNGRPGFFTLLGRTLYLDPPPDANGTAGYTGIGVYVQDLTPEVLDDVDVPLTYAQALVPAALAELASDTGHGRAQALREEAAQTVTSLVNREARTAQGFQRRHTQIGRAGRYRRL